MSDNVVKTAAEELKKWLDVLQQLIKEKQAHDAKIAAKLDKAEMRQLQEMRHEQMMAKFDKLANNGGEVSELKKAVEEAQKEIQSLRKQLEGPDELEADAEKQVQAEAQKVQTEKQKQAEEQKLEANKQENKQPGNTSNDIQSVPKAGVVKLDADHDKAKIGSHRAKTGADAGLEKGGDGKWQRVQPKKSVEGPKLEMGKHRVQVGGIK